MARRLNTRHSELCRQKIQVTQLVNRLMGHIEGKVDLSNSQVNSIKILLDKSLPSLSDVKTEHVSQGITFNLKLDESVTDVENQEEDQE